MEAPKGGICPSQFAGDDGKLVMFTTLRIGRPSIRLSSLSLLSTNKRQEQTTRLPSLEESNLIRRWLCKNGQITTTTMHSIHSDPFSGGLQFGRRRR